MIYDRYQVKGKKHKKNFSTPFINVGGADDEIRESRDKEGESDFALMEIMQRQSPRN